MAVSVQEIYDEVCDAILEPGGLQLGLLSESQFLEFVRVVSIDFLQKTGIIKDTFTVSALFAITEYDYPSDCLKMEHVFWDSGYLQPTDAFSMDHSSTNWENDIDNVETWREDRLAARTFAVHPAPPVNGTDFTVIGTKNVVPSTITLSSSIPSIPESMTFYIWAGVMHKIHSMDGEMKDDFKASYFWNRYMEGVQLGQAIMNEALSGV